MEFGYFLSSEEFGPVELVRQAEVAGEHGFDKLWISDHFHPWIDRQGHSPFVWSVIGTIAGRCPGESIDTAVTCPTVRIHPAVLAQAAATSACLLDGRFRFGVGSGENLNEHILGDRWPEVDVRHEMLEEAVEVIRLLWTGETVSHRGRHYTVENARIYDLPDDPPPILVSAFGPKATELAARIGDGLVNVAPVEHAVEQFRADGGETKPCVAGVKVCWGEDARAAADLAAEVWPNAALSGELSQELPTPGHFEQACELVTVEAVADSTPHGPDPARYIEVIRAFDEAGFDELFFQQVGGDVDGFATFFRREIEPAL